MIDEAVVSRVLGTALRTGGDFAEVFVEDKRSSSAHLDDGKIEELGSGRDRGAGIRVVVGDTTGFAHTADLSESGLQAAAEAAAAAASGGGGGTKTVALTRRDAPRHHEIEIAPGDVAKATKVDLLRRADEVARSKGDAIRQVSASYADSRRRILVANSDGLLAEDDQTRTLFVVARRGHRRHRHADRPGEHRPHRRLRAVRPLPGRRPRRPGRRAGHHQARGPSRAERRAAGRRRRRAAAASCSTRPAATASRPTTSRRTSRCSPVGSASRSPRRSSPSSTTAPSPPRGARSPSTTRARRRPTTC